MLRIGVVGGGCSGFAYNMDFLNDESEVNDENDRVYSIEGICFIVDKKSALFLKGTVLDFDDGLNGKGFVFSNPNSKTTCGCGMSFGV